MQHPTLLLNCCLLALSLPTSSHAAEPARGTAEVYTEFYDGVEKGDGSWVQSIQVSEPPYRAEIRGDVTVRFKAPGMTAATASCWQQPVGTEQGNWGHDETLTPHGISLDAEGNGSFLFPADRFPNGPINVRILARDKSGKRDLCELQLFNQGGVKWKQGIPDMVPAPAKGMRLIFADDFDKPLSISNDGRGSTYNAHKPRYGDFSGWQFSDFLGPGKPFSRTGTWLRIAARKDAESPQGRSGLLASVDMDGKGLWAQAPCYLECRFTAQSAIGTWPAFWTITHLDPGSNGDELDIVEAYGGRGKGNPNHPGYSVVGHFWGQKNPDGSQKDHPNSVVKMMDTGGKSYWSTTFHTYGCLIDMIDTVYYLDDIEVFRHPTGEVSKKSPHCFLINYAIGGISGWKIDLSRYQEGSDMWVDYVRVFADKAIPDHVMSVPGSTAGLSTAGIGFNFMVAGDASTELDPADIAGFPAASQPNWNNLPGPSGKSVETMDNSGKIVSGTTATWSVPAGDNAWRSAVARDWGFKGSSLKLQKGYIQLGGSLDIGGIPYRKYDVYIYLGAGDNAGKGKVSISSVKGGINATASRYYDLRWLDGKFVPATSESLDSANVSNMVVFSGNTSPEIRLEWAGNLEGGWTGVTGVQIISTP